jgi:hypothetical protein
MRLAALLVLAVLTVFLVLRVRAEDAVKRRRRD